MSTNLARGQILVHGQLCYQSTSTSLFLLWQLHAVKLHFQLTSVILQVLVTRYEQLDRNVVSLYPFQSFKQAPAACLSRSPAADFSSRLCCIVIRHSSTSICTWLLVKMSNHINAGQASCAVMGEEHKCGASDASFLAQ